MLLLSCATVKSTDSCDRKWKVLMVSALPKKSCKLISTKRKWHAWLLGCLTRSMVYKGHRGNFDIVPLCTHRQTYWQTDTLQCPKILISSHTTCPIPGIMRVLLFILKSHARPIRFRWVKYAELLTVNTHRLAHTRSCRRRSTSSARCVCSVAQSSESRTP